MPGGDDDGSQRARVDVGVFIRCGHSLGCTPRGRGLTARSRTEASDFRPTPHIKPAEDRMQRIKTQELTTVKTAAPTHQPCARPARQYDTSRMAAKSEMTNGNKKNAAVQYQRLESISLPQPNKDRYHTTVSAIIRTDWLRTFTVICRKPLISA